MEKEKTEFQNRENLIREEGYISGMEECSLKLLQTAEQTKEEAEQFYPQMLEMDDYTEVEKRVESLKRAAANMSRAMAQTYAVSDELSARSKDITNQRKKRRFLPNAPANTTIDVKESESGHFAQGLNTYKLLLVCFIGSFAGVVIELLWCLLRNGYLESRSGLVYGPFNLLYGAGAVALSGCLYKFRNKGAWISFLGGMLVGSVVEYLCSWGQEMLFGSRSWDYSGVPFNLNGRICLLYSFFWGFLGVWWIKDMYPRMAKWILRIPNAWGKAITWCFTVFFIFNSLVSLAAVGRWSERLEGLEPSNAVEEFLDERFHNERMERIYANMEFGK
ncbi:MAG: putative ABC transporter permease [Lachnospiraceae bacterium]|nr:putative ABC transporter permease [Lachnospiraceae bacterium]